VISLPEIQNFMLQMSKILESKQQFVNQPTEKETRKIPEYTLGVPYCDDDVCYLEFDEAYDKNKQ
jgi:hypothetical protein